MMTDKYPELREKIWEILKDWDIQHSRGQGHVFATETDMDAILNAIEKTMLGGEYTLLNGKIYEIIGWNTNGDYGTVLVRLASPTKSGGK